MPHDQTFPRLVKSGAFTKCVSISSALNVISDEASGLMSFTFTGYWELSSNPFAFSVAIPFAVPRLDAKDVTSESKLSCALFRLYEMRPRKWFMSIRVIDEA